MMKTNTKKKLEKKPLDGIDWGLNLAPLLIILVISAALMLVPIEEAYHSIEKFLCQ